MDSLHSNVEGCRNLPAYQEELREIIRHCEKGLTLQEPREVRTALVQKKSKAA